MSEIAITGADDMIADLVAVSRETAAWVSDAQLSAMGSFEDAVKAFTKLGIADIEATGLELIDKASLVGVKHLMVAWSFNESDKFPGRGYVVVKVMTADGRKGFYTDGGGIYRTLADRTRERLVYLAENPSAQYPATGALMAEVGLRVSEFQYEIDKNGNPLYGADGRVKVVPAGNPEGKRVQAGSSFYLG